ncbi:hypothetical protein Ahy_B03g061944 isoform E [Arachis hypogaea]|uniref:Uncharacterized protein n=1 Tax=Arachis hypogaea TaxID=3818 RepID=A0A444ZSM0_ARAHY|nr:hypothetical protein Ahy_B03g061944 isoform E [Arachis hypogaea]
MQKHIRTGITLAEIAIILQPKPELPGFYQQRHKIHAFSNKATLNEFVYLTSSHNLPKQQLQPQFLSSQSKWLHFLPKAYSRKPSIPNLHHSKVQTSDS